VKSDIKKGIDQRVNETTHRVRTTMRYDPDIRNGRVLREKTLPEAEREILMYLLDVGVRNPKVINRKLKDLFDEVIRAGKRIAKTDALEHGRPVAGATLSIFENPIRRYEFHAMNRVRIAIAARLAGETLLGRLDRTFRDNPFGVLVISLGSLVALVAAIVSLVDKLRH